MLTLEEHAASWQDMAPHIATLTRLAQYADSILELGIRAGVSTWALLDGLPPDGRMTSVDIAPLDLPARITTDPRWRQVIGDDREPALYHQLPAGFDLAFIDTSHEYHHTLEELTICASLGAQTIVLHDWMLDDVHDAVTGFCSRRPWKIEGIEPSQWGMVWLSRRS